MKKTCEGCYVAEREGRPLDVNREISGCCLGYKNENGCPKEDCPKPKSWKQLKRFKKELSNE